MQIEEGSANQVLSLPLKLCSALATSFWFKSFWGCMSMHQMITSIPNFDLPSPASFQDKLLMNIAVSMKTYTPFQIHQLNIIRINLKVIFLSDIVLKPLT